MACVDHKPFIVGIIYIYKSLKYSFPNAFVPPPAETSVDVVPAAIFRRQITPWRSGPQYPEYGIDKLSIVACIAAPCSLPARKKWFQQGPYFIADIVSVVIFRHLFGLHSAFRSIITNIYCRHYLGKFSIQFLLTSAHDVAKKQAIRTNFFISSFLPASHTYCARLKTNSPFLSACAITDSINDYPLNT